MVKYMKNIVKKILPAMAMLIMAFCLAGCSGPVGAGYDKLKSEEEIQNYLIRAMEQNKTDCQFNVETEDLIDPNSWVKIPGVKNISCEHRQVIGGYDVKVSITYWDNYPIVYAYKNNDPSKLTAKQKELFDEYKRVLNMIEGKESVSEDSTNASVEQSTEAVKQLPIEEKILKIHDYLVENTSYDSSLDYMYDAYDTLLEHRAICSGYAEVFKTFMDMMGVECITITGVAGNENHMWNIIKLDNEWYHVDVTWDDPIGNKSGSIYHSYFNVDDASISKDHSWERENYPKAEGTKYSYNNMMGIKVLYSQEELEDYIAELAGKREGKAEIMVYGQSDVKKAFSKMVGKVLSYSAKIESYSDYKIYHLTMKY